MAEDIDLPPFAAFVGRTEDGGGPVAHAEQMIMEQLVEEIGKFASLRRGRPSTGSRRSFLNGIMTAYYALLDTARDGKNRKRTVGEIGDAFGRSRSAVYAALRTDGPGRWRGQSE